MFMDGKERKPHTCVKYFLRRNDQVVYLLHDRAKRSNNNQQEKNEKMTRVAGSR
jgi:hypothetical protein